MHRSSGTRSARVLLAALTAAGLAIAGCGSDKDAATATTAAKPATTSNSTATTTAAASTTSAAPPTTKASTTTAAHHDSSPATTGAAAAAGGGATNAYCAAALDVSTVASAAGDPDADPAAFAQALLTPVQAAAALAPAAIAPTYATATAALQSAVAGDPSQLDAAMEAGGKVDEFDIANCPWKKVPVTLENYHFTGLPATMPAGDYVFALDNAGTELHVMVIVKRKPGVTESFAELLADPAGEDKVDTVIADGAPPGGSANAIGHLDAGEYLVLCPIPLGSGNPQTEGTGPPHFTVGMQQPLTIT
jgi:hypothetical protein